MNNLRWQEVEAFVPVRYELGVFLVLIFKWRVVMLSDGASGSGTSRFLHLVQQVYSNRTLKCLRIISTSACGRVGFHSVWAIRKLRHWSADARGFERTWCVWGSVIPFFIIVATWLHILVTFLVNLTWIGKLPPPVQRFSFPVLVFINKPSYENVHM